MTILEDKENWLLFWFKVCPLKNETRSMLFNFITILLRSLSYTLHVVSVNDCLNLFSHYRVLIFICLPDELLRNTDKNVFDII